jgi:HEAT repeat protein
MRSRFYGMLEAYQQGLSERERPKRRAWLHWWPTQPALQFGLSAALLLIGFTLGRGVFTPAESSRELSQLRGEVSGMRQLVTLSLLQQQSASERLKGVSWSYQVAQSDTEVLAALLQTVNRDASVNVRLAAVDALRQFRSSPVMRKGLVNSLAKQSSPLVQIGVIDLLVELNEKPAIAPLNRLLESSDLDPNVRHRAQWAVQQLS